MIKYECEKEIRRFVIEMRGFRKYNVILEAGYGAKKGKS